MQKYNSLCNSSSLLKQNPHRHPRGRRFDPDQVHHRLTSFLSLEISNSACASSNGAKFLGLSNEIGSLSNGKNADIVIVKGTPDKQISDIRNVYLVFKDGMGFSSEKLIKATQGEVGIH